MENVGDEISSLRKMIAEYERLYRIENAPAISDAEYDRLLRRLRDLEDAHPEFYSADSPTQKVGDDASSGFEKRAHLSKMLSLDNAFSFEDLKEFDERLRRAIGSSKALKYVVEPKIDGAGISAVYENGKLSRLLTRGNGSVGDDITRNVSVVKNLPLELSGGNIPKLLEVRGEAFMANSEFDKIRARQEAEFAADEQAQFDGEEEANPSKKIRLYANPRNLAAGTLKLLDKKILAQRSLLANFYSIGKIEGAEILFQSDLAKFLKSLGLPSVNWYSIAFGIDEVFQKICLLDKERGAFDFNTDGAVVKLDDMSLYSLAGWTSKFPRWATAWKYKPARAKVRIYDITLQVGRTGAITPVAELEDAKKEGARLPVLLSGTNVSRATLHNFDEIARKDIRIGDVVEIEKAGEIIPDVVRILPEYRNENAVAYAAPKHCPKCGSTLVRNIDEAVLRCINPECPEQMRRRIIHFASRACMDIDGLGDAVVSQLVSLGILKNSADIYTLNADDLYKIKNFKQKSVENLLSAIQDSKKRDLWRLISGLGIPYVGERAAKDFALAFKSLDSFMSADMKALSDISGVGERIIFSVLQFFKSDENLRIINRLRESGLNFKAEENSQSAAFGGKIFALTGTLNSMGRSDAKRLIESYGGRVGSGVSKTTDFLISASESSSKLDKARELGVKILGEDEFLSMLKEAEASAGFGVKSDETPIKSKNSSPQNSSGQMSLFDF